MKACDKCGFNQLKEDYKYCPNCGDVLFLQEKKKPDCSSCNLENTDQCDMIACFDEFEQDTSQNYPYDL